MSKKPWMAIDQDWPDDPRCRALGLAGAWVYLRIWSVAVKERREVINGLWLNPLYLSSVCGMGISEDDARKAVAAICDLGLVSTLNTGDVVVHGVRSRHSGMAGWDTQGDAKRLSEAGIQCEILDGDQKGRRSSLGMENGKVPHSTVQYRTVRESTVQYGTVRESTGKYGTVPYSTVLQDRTGQDNTGQDKDLALSTEHSHSPLGAAPDPTVQPAPRAPRQYDPPLSERIRIVQAAWNAMAAENGLPIREDVMGTGVEKPARARVGSKVWWAKWEKALGEIPGRKFLLGGNDRGWKATFEWFMRPESVEKILSGEYRNGQAPVGQVPGKYDWEEEA